MSRTLLFLQWLRGKFVLGVKRRTVLFQNQNHGLFQVQGARIKLLSVPRIRRLPVFISGVP